MGHILKMPQAKQPSGYRMAKRGSDRAEIYLYGIVGDFWGDGVSAKKFADDLKSLGKGIKAIDLRINSEGGDVFAGKAIYSLLVSHEARVVAYVDGLAASIASFVAMAADEIVISEGAFMMVHNAWTVAIGGAADLRSTADLLDTVSGTIRDAYAARTKNSAEKIGKLMDDETWMTGKEAVELGFADSMVENLKVAASVSDPSRFKHLPAALKPNTVRARAALSAMSI